MNNRHGRNPGADLQRHIATGETGPFNGQGIANDLDNADINRDDPMEYGGQANTFEGQSVDEITAASEAQHTGLDSGDGAIGQRGGIDMGLVSGNHGQDTTQASSMPYGQSALDAWRKDNQ